VLKRPKKRVLKANAAEREAFVALYAALRAEAAARGAKIFFVDEAHFRADADLRGKWVLKGEPALVDSTSPRWGEQASYYSAVCLETGEVELLELAGNSTAATSVAFLRQLRAHHSGPLIVIWDKGPAHRGEALRTYLATPGLDLRLVPSPAYSPDFNADEAIWDRAREEVTANTCLGTKAKVQEQVGAFFRGLAERTAEVPQRCRTLLQASADALGPPATEALRHTIHGDSTLALV
jgi:transposase